MDERFRRIFGFLTDAYSSDLERLRFDEWSNLNRIGLRTSTRNLALISRDAIERAMGGLSPDVRIRADALHFLLVTFTEMVVKPIELAPSGDYSTTELAADIQADAMDILQTASSSSRQRELTGGDVLNAAAQKYSELRVAKYRVWN